MSPSIADDPAPAPVADLIHFACGGCGMPLSVPMHMAGVSGPCPQCGEVLMAPATPLIEWRNIASQHRAAPLAAAPLPALPTAGGGVQLSTFDLVLRSTAFRLLVLAVLLVAPALYFGNAGSSAAKAPIAQAPVLRLKNDPIKEDSTSGAPTRYRMLNGTEEPGMHTAAGFAGSGDEQEQTKKPSKSRK